MLRKKTISPPVIDGKHSMTGLELSDADDLATMMTVDSVLGFTTHKMDKNFNTNQIDKRLKEKFNNIMQEFINEPNYEQTFQQLMANDKVKTQWKKSEQFKRHIFRFLYLFDKRSGIEVRPCDRYENEGKRGAGIFSTKEWERGSQITTLFGCIAEIHPKDEDYFRKNYNEFSVMYSTRKNCSQLWLGPAAYVNHDCKPNCRFTEGNDDTKMLLETLRDIQPGDELLIYYGNNFFGIDNEECECFTCELRGRGLFNRLVTQNNNNFQLNGVDNDIYYNMSNTNTNFPTIHPNNNNNNHDNSSRRIVTRSHKMKTNTNGIGECAVSISTNGSIIPVNHNPQSINNNFNTLKRPSNSYSLRITYSRIDRVKRSIKMNSNPIVDIKQHHTTSSTTGSSISGKIGKNTKTYKPSSKLNNHDNDTDCIIISTSHPIKPRRLTRSIQNHYHHSTPHHNHNLLPQQLASPMKIKLRKSPTRPGCYDNCTAVTETSDSTKSSANIFSRLNEYLSSNHSSSSPSDTPPSLSPWFHTGVVKDECDEEESGLEPNDIVDNASLMEIKENHNITTRNNGLLKVIKLSASKPPIIVNNNHKKHHRASSKRKRLNKTKHNNISPPILPLSQEFGSTTFNNNGSNNNNGNSILIDLTPPHLDCEEGQECNNSNSNTNNNCSYTSSTDNSNISSSKSIVMKISRINGNRFKSLLSS